MFKHILRSSDESELSAAAIQKDGAGEKNTEVLS